MIKTPIFSVILKYKKKKFRILINFFLQFLNILFNFL